MNIEEIYYNKYLKYKSKYLELKNEFTEIDFSDNNNILYGGKKFRNNKFKSIKSSDNRSSGSRYTCDPDKEFLDICNQDNKGYYKSKEKCQNDCETKYIKRNLVQAKLKNETMQFNLFIQDLMIENITVYIKGGTVLGLKILKMIYDKYGNNNQEFEDHFNEFVKVNLIRDWDFACYTENGKDITEKYRSELDKLAHSHRLVPRAKTFVLYQAKYPIKVNDQALFEIAILESENYVDMELPLTTMKIKINRRNLFHVFMLAKLFYSSDPIDLNVIKYIIKDMNIIIPEAKDGLFVRKELNKGNLSEKLIDLIIKFSKGNINLQQFLVTHIQEPNRLLYRLLEKNIPKIIKIKTFLKENDLWKDNISWLGSQDYFTSIADSFIEELGSKLYLICINNKDKDIFNTIKELDLFLEGVNLTRIQIEYKNFTCKGYDLLKIWFGRIYTELFENTEVLEIKDSKLVTIMTFMIEQKLFQNEN